MATEMTTQELINELEKRQFELTERNKLDIMAIIFNTHSPTVYDEDKLREMLEKFNMY